MIGVLFEVNGVRKYSDDDFNLHLEPVNIPFPVPKTKFIEKEFGDGSIDLTEASGKVFYKDRNFQLTFIADNKVMYMDKMNKLSSFIHGKELKMTFWFDPEYYYVGRATINQYKSNNYIGSIVVNVQTRPYKYKKEVTVQIDKITNERVVVYKNGRMDVVPTFKSTAEINFEYLGNHYSLGTSETMFPNIVFTEGDNVIKWTGNAEVTVSYQEGML